MSDKIIIIELESYARYFRSDQPSHNLLLANNLEKGVAYIKKLESQLSEANSEIESLSTYNLELQLQNDLFTRLWTLKLPQPPIEGG